MAPWDDDEHDLGEGLDPDGPSAEDLDRFGDEMLTCPHCGANASDQAQFCPVCAKDLDERPAGSPPVPMWAWITLFVAIVLILFFAF